jgi:hypothetical protein
MKQLWTILFAGFAVGAYSQQVSSLTNFEIEDDSADTYSFWVSGHFYGNSLNKTGYPANTLLGSISMLNESDATMMICLGDLFLDVRNDIPFYQKSLLTPLKIPLYNAVGNHDISGKVYQENFGDTYAYFILNNDIHLILDTEINNGDIENEQLEMLSEALNMTRYEDISNVFIYGHRTVFKDMYEEMDDILQDNTQSIRTSNFEDDVFPLLEKISENAKVFWFAGSIGGEAPASFLYHKDSKNDITYIATAIRALPRDAMLKVKSDNGSVTFETVSLTGQDLMRLEDYSLDYWENNSAREPFNWRLLPLYIKQTILSWSFFFGAISSILCFFIIRFFLRKMRRTKPLR